MEKAQTIRGLIDARKKILRAADTAPKEKRDEIFLGVWSLKDLLAHLVGWDYANRDSVEDIRAGKSPRVFEHWNPDWKAFNAQLVKQHKCDDWNELLQTLQASHRELIRFLKTVPSEEFEKDFGVRSPRGRTITIAQHLHAEMEDEAEHTQQIRAWLERR